LALPAPGLGAPCAGAWRSLRRGLALPAPGLGAPCAGLGAPCAGLGAPHARGPGGSGRRRAVDPDSVRPVHRTREPVPILCSGGTGSGRECMAPLPGSVLRALRAPSREGTRTGSAATAVAGGCRRRQVDLSGSRRTRSGIMAG
jgi:hypothetical protein